MRPRIRTVGILVLLASLLIAAPVAAASPWTSSNQSGTTAFADAIECQENLDGTVTCEGESLFVFAGTMKINGEPNRKGEQVCYGESISTFDPTTGELLDDEGVFGCALDAGTLSIDNLTSIVLAPTVIELTAWECDEFDCTETPAGTATVSGTWTGVGPISSHKGRSTFDDGTCIQVDSDRSSFREASFTGSFEALSAQMSEGRFTFRTSCTFEEPA